MHALAHFLGLDNVSGPQYAAWSGFAGDLTVIGAVVVFWHRHTCHVRHCWRPGRHPVAGTSFTTCRKHNPNIPNKAPTAEHIAEAANGTDSE